MSVVQFSGLASGLDTNAIIEAMLGVERIPLQRIEAQNSDLSSQKGILDSLSSALSKLRTKAKALGESKDFLSYKGTSSDTDVAKITAGGDAVRGNYKLEVETLAQSQRNYSNEILDKTSELTATDTTFSMTIGGTVTSFAVQAGSTLEDLVRKINESGAGVSAGLLSTGAGGYRLQLSGNSTGAANAITFNEGGLGLDLAGNQIEDAKDAAFKIDGFSITSPTNVVTDVLPGATIELFSEHALGEFSTLKIAPDKDAVKGKIKEFADAYNGVMAVINAQVGEGKGTNTLNGDGTVRSIEQQLAGLVSSPIPGLFDSDGVAMALSNIGFESQRDGTVKVNDTTLTSALDKSFEGVARYFGGSADGVAGISDLFDNLIKGLVDGKQSLIGSRAEGITSRIRSNENSITDQQKYLDAYEAQLRAQYTALESTMSQLQSQGNYLAQFLQ